MVNYQKIYENVQLSCKDQAELPLSYRELNYAMRMFVEEVVDAAVEESKASVVGSSQLLCDIAAMAADLKLQVEELEDATTSLLNGEEPRGEQ